MLATGISPVWIDVGESTTAIAKSTRYVERFAAVESTTPAATADARSTPCFWRKRTCDAIPPTAGTARFENDIESCSSLVRHNGIGCGTVPISATADGMLVASDSTRARSNHHQLAAEMVRQNSPGSPIWLSSAAPRRASRRP